MEEEAIRAAGRFQHNLARVVTVSRRRKKNVTFIALRLAMLCCLFVNGETTGHTVYIGRVSKLDIFMRVKGEFVENVVVYFQGIPFECGFGEGGDISVGGNRFYICIHCIFKRSPFGSILHSKQCSLSGCVCGYS